MNLNHTQTTTDESLEAFSPFPIDKKLKATKAHNWLNFLKKVFNFNQK